MLMDREAFFVTFFLFLFPSLFLVIVSNGNFVEVASTSFIYSAQSLAPQTFNTLGILWILTLAVVNFRTGAPPDQSSFIVRVAFVHPFNGFAATGIAAAAIFCSWSIGFFYYYPGEKLAYICLFGFFYIVLVIGGLAYFYHLLSNETFSSNELRVLGGLTLYGLVIFLLLKVSSDIASSL